MSIAAAALAASATPSYAFKSVRIATYTATATTSGTNQADFTMRWATTANQNTINFGTTTLSWSSFDPLTTTWKMANQVIVMNSTVTDSLGGIVIYTDNTNAGAVPQFVFPVPGTPNNQANQAAGLLKGTAGTTSVAPLPLAWTIKTSSRTIEGGTDTTGVGAADPQTGLATAVFNNKFQWLNMTDKGNWTAGLDYNGDGDSLDAGDQSAMGYTTPFVTIRNLSGIHFGQADTEFGAIPQGSNSWIYVETNFATASVLQAYQTNQLKVEAFIN